MLSISYINPRCNNQAFSTHLMNTLGGGVEADAFWCRKSSQTNACWWGTRTRMNKCAAEDISFNWSNYIQWIGWLCAFMCGIVGLYNPAMAGFVCASAVGAIVIYYGSISSYLDRYSSRCEGGWVNFDFNWWLAWSVKC